MAEILAVKRLCGWWGGGGGVGSNALLGHSHVTFAVTIRTQFLSTSHPLYSCRLPILTSAVYPPLHKPKK